MASPNRVLSHLIPAALAALVLAVLLSPPAIAGAAARDGDRSQAQRRGGTVRPAWPLRSGERPPDSRLGRWLARQVGPAAPVARARARARARGRNRARAAAASAAQPLLLVRSFEIPKSDPPTRS